MTDSLPPTTGTLLERLGITIEEVTPQRATGTSDPSAGARPADHHSCALAQLRTYVVRGFRTHEVRTYRTTRLP